MKSNPTRKRQPKEKLPAAVTSKVWQEHHARKDEKKQALEVAKEEKKGKRAQKAEESKIAP